MTRREWIVGTAALVAAQQLPQAPTTRPNVGQIDRERILRATAAAAAIPTTSLGPDTPQFLAFTLSVPALAAAVVIDPPNAEKYRAAAASQLKAWLVAEDTKLVPDPVLSEKKFGHVTDLSAFGEMCVAIPFLGLDDDLLASVKDWFATRLKWLTENRTALLARDAKDHHGASWLLQTTAAAKLTGAEAVTTDCKHRFKTTTIRAQINAEGLFGHELTSENPFRNSLFTLDLLAGTAQLLSTQFDSIWDYELQDGPGMRTAVANHSYYIRERVKWPYPADQSHFNLLPGRRPTLVFAGRAYGNAEYVTLWRGLNADPTEPEILRTFPIRQPVLWLPLSRAAS